MDINFNKNSDQLVPAIIQDYLTDHVLMLGYMNQEAYLKTLNTGQVTFFSRSKNRLWTKGERSGHFLEVHKILVDCDIDSLLIKVKPHGPTCHKGTTSCFGEPPVKGFLYELEQTIGDRIDQKSENSYTHELYKKGINKIAQKIGEEAVEVVIEAKDQDDALFKNEVADLLYHLLILLKAKGISLEAVEKVLKNRR
ncbi:bifunctional phosphoribosyl-AMP cyclohydrolase/phosphoribosyl-ATP diphosphatase HisIE [Elizabethkingia argentiflava]|uniref:Histidine biosynthesis bifunctional protein HisIE n=1 Tax=Elizabethkingia argenteiflava TaxID=2681556 RepID=A0A845PUU1_9FLAO|nr:bifunctional phosphoribosyl-AMP cyclohydrolase/phosphoribosyl-ATP diphosphatase HisIE [Elizabethkingia argenteiflava]NAW50863.1 bifunctional phosphoribosyl-AMP cyclohydrolase/phosphoribosyl-ATP diphosphatase HisIE [Elizabethkingia argenteiflava]